MAGMTSTRPLRAIPAASDAIDIATLGSLQQLLGPTLRFPQAVSAIADFKQLAIVSSSAPNIDPTRRRNSWMRLRRKKTIAYAVLRVGLLKMRLVATTDSLVATGFKC